MDKKNEHKLCWNCDGRVERDVEKCLYCGVDLTHTAPISSSASSTSTARPIDSLNVAAEKPYSESPYPGAPYAPSSPYASHASSLQEEKTIEIPLVEESKGAEGGGHRKELTALLLLLPGVVFFLFGLMLLLFSQDGVLSLHWNKSFAYFYFLGALPLLFLSWRALR